MSKGVLAWLGSVMMTGAVVAQTQTTVVTKSLTAGAIPVFGTTSGSNSPVTSISVSGGNVGIGTTAPPTAVLEVNGTAKVDGALTLAGSQNFAAWVGSISVGLIPAAPGAASYSLGKILCRLLGAHQNDSSMHEVGQKLTNGFRLYDVLGNVWESI